MDKAGHKKKHDKGTPIEATKDKPAGSAGKKHEPTGKKHDTKTSPTAERNDQRSNRKSYGKRESKRKVENSPVTTEKRSELSCALKDIETIKDLRKVQDKFSGATSPKSSKLKSHTGTPDPISSEKSPAESTPDTTPDASSPKSPGGSPDDFLLEDFPKPPSVKPLDHKSTRSSLQLLYNESPKTVDTCTKVLHIFIQRVQKVSLSHSPAYQFTLEQMYLTAMEIRLKIESQVATYTLIQSLTNNLVTLFKIRILPQFVEDSRLVATNLKSLMSSCAELCNALEKMARVNITDWKAVAEMQVTLADEVLETVPNRKAKVTDYVQNMSNFKFREVLGYGKYGNVCKVVFIPTGAELAMKIVPFSKIKFSPTHLKTTIFVDKSVCALASDPFLMKVHATWMVKPEAYVILMDYPKSGVDVSRILREIGFLDETTTGFIILQTVYAIEHVHFMGFIHRDVEPSNIIIDKYCKVKLTDFDSAKICRGHYLRKIMTSYFKKTAMEFRDQDIVGSISYTAPEVLRKTAYGRASDWWSLGVCLYKISSARLPFRGKDVAHQIMTSDYVWGLNHSASVSAKEMVHDLLRKSPRKRLGSRVYSDILTHKYIQQYSNTVDEIAPVDASFEGMAELTNPKYKIFLEEALMEVDLIDTLPEIKPPADAKKHLTFKQLQDLDVKKHHNLFTYASLKFKKLIDRPAHKMRDKEIYLVPCTPPIEEMDYTLKEMQTTFAATTTKTMVDNQRNRQMDKTHKVIPYTGTGANKKLSVEFMRCRADGRIFYLIINKILFKEHKHNYVIEGDIVVSIMKRDALDKSLSEITKILDFVLKTLPDGEEVSCCVLDSSTTRLLKSGFEAEYGSARKSKLTIRRKDTVCPYPNPDATLPQLFTTRRLKCDSSKKLYHVVWYIHPNIEVKEAASLLYGDILSKVNDKLCKSMSESDLNAYVGSLGSTRMTVEIAQMSSLRRPDLLETAAGDEDEEPVVL